MRRVWKQYKSIINISTGKIWVWNGGDIYQASSVSWWQKNKLAKVGPNDLAYEISSNWTNFQKDIVYFRQFFQVISIHSFFFDNVLSKYLNSTFCPELPVMSVSKLPIFITLPYIGNSSHHCKKQLLNIVNKYFPQVNLSCIFVNLFTLS